jgi:hypothetical protein
MIRRGREVGMVRWPAQDQAWKGESHGGNENSMLKRQQGVCRHEQRFGRAPFLYHIGAREAHSCHLLWSGPGI